MMRNRAVYFLVIVLIAAFAASYARAADEKIVVFNPRGIQPDIRKIPMAPRQATLDGKTVYIVDTKYPKTTWIVRDKVAGYMDDDPNLWKEIKEKGAGAIVLLGH